MGRWLGVGALALGLFASSSAVASAATDLQSLLAPPPSSDWVVPTSGRWLLGSFTAQSYGAFADQLNATPGNTAANLNNDGFVTGYGDAWVDTATRDQLVERVFEFKYAFGAADWFNGVKEASEGLKERQSDIPSAARIPNSFGVYLLFPDAAQWRVDFQKGNLVFVVHTNSASAGEDLSALAVSQAQGEWQGAPSSVATGLSGSSMLPTWLLPVGGSIIATILIATVGTIVVIWLATRRRAAAPAPSAPAGVQVSPDGHYRWDGTAWRPTQPRGP